MSIAKEMCSGEICKFCQMPFADKDAPGYERECSECNPKSGFKQAELVPCTAEEYKKLIEESKGGDNERN